MITLSERISRSFHSGHSKSERVYTQPASLAGTSRAHVSRAMFSRYSHMRVEAKRRALDEIATRQSVADEKRKTEVERQQQATLARQSAGVVQ